MGVALFRSAKWLRNLPVLVSLLILMYPAVLACVNIAYHLSLSRPGDPWEAALIAEGWRASNHIAVYESQEVGHATLMYGPAEPFVLGWLFKLFGPAKLVPQLLSLGGALCLVLLGWAILRPFLSALCQCLAILSFVAIEYRVSYFAEGRPDLLAWAFGIAGLFLAFLGHRNKWNGGYVIGAALTTAAVCFKQTAAMLTVVPPIALLICERRSVLLLSLLFSLMPVVFVGVFFLCIYLLAPDLYHYMVVVPRSYPIRMDVWLRGMSSFIAGAVCLWFGLGLVLGAASPLEESPFGLRWRQQICWVGVMLVVTLPVSALTAAKAGGTLNSLIPAWFSLITLSWLLLAPFLAHSQTVRSMPKGYPTIVSALAILFTLVPVPLSLRYYLHHWNQSNKEYAEVISRVKTLRGRVLSPEDPTITLNARGEINRSIFVEYDALGWPSAIPQFLLTELSQADYIVMTIDWSVTREIIRYDDLVGLGFELNWSNDCYAIWKASAVQHP
jgi:hypothetical protein